MLAELARQLQKGQFPEFERKRPGRCVIASLESAFAAHATHEERLLREQLAAEKKAKIMPYQPYARTAEGAIMLFQANLILETRSMAELFRRLQTHQTPLGRAMSKYTFTSHAVRDSETLEELVIPGNTILLAEASVTDEWHMMHARRVDTGKIVSASDGNTVIALKPKTAYMAYNFVRKQ